MGMVITITPNQPVVLTTSSTDAIIQPLSEAVDALVVDVLELELVILAASVGTNGVVGLATGMQLQSEGGWAYPTAGSSLAIVSGPISGAKPPILVTIDKGFLRYLRWYFKPDASGDSITFYIRGAARRYGT